MNLHKSLICNHLKQVDAKSDFEKNVIFGQTDCMIDINRKDPVLTLPMIAFHSYL